MKRLLPAIALATAALALGAGPAVAHEELSPPTVPAARPAFLILSAANERQVAATSVTLAPPSGLTLGSVSRDPAGWTVERAGGAATWSGGSVAPGKFEQFGIELEAPDQPGSFTFRSTLRFADGRTDTHDVVLTVSQAGATATTTPAPQATVTTVTAATPTSASPPTTAAGPVTEAAAGDGDSAEGRANLALAVGAVGLLLGLAALAMAARRSPAGAGGGPAPKEQEW